MIVFYFRRMCVTFALLAMFYANSFSSAQEASSTVTASQLGIGSRISVSSSNVPTLNEVMTRTVGNVSDSAVARYGSDFDAYYQASRTSREGKALEAIATDLVNHRNSATGTGNRWQTSASLGYPSHAADIVEIDSSGKLVRQIQAGKGFSNVLSKLSDSKYEGMSILTDQDTYDALRTELTRETLRANALGKPLNPKFAKLQDAVNSGRLLDRLPCGAPLPTQNHIATVAKKHAVGLYESKLSIHSAKTASLGSNAIASTDDVVSSSTKVLPSIAKHSQRLVRGVPLVAAGFEAINGYAEISTTETEYASGQIDDQQREVRHARTAGRIGGGVAGAAIGAQTLASVGGTVGSVGGPVGTAVGVGVGGIVGGIGGAIGGEKLIADGAEALTTALHNTGHTVSDSATGAWRWTKSTASTAWNWLSGD